MLAINYMNYNSNEIESHINIFSYNSFPAVVCAKMLQVCQYISGYTKDHGDKIKNSMDV